MLASHKAFAKTRRGLCSRASLRSGLVLRCDSLLHCKYATAGGVRTAIPLRSDNQGWPLKPLYTSLFFESTHKISFTFSLFNLLTIQ